MGKTLRVSEIHPLFYQARIKQKIWFRFLINMKYRKKFAKNFNKTSAPFSCKKHQSLLRRRLGDSDPKLQDSKIINLSIASRTIDGITINPGEVFFFWELVGKTTKDKGYIEGMQLSMGEVKTGIGGGICQLANLLYWMALHTPLKVIERHHHSFDQFPDSGRVLPFNYIKEELLIKNYSEVKYEISPEISRVTPIS